jgi:RND family efflux transporter MFP subunit
MRGCLDIAAVALLFCLAACDAGGPEEARRPQNVVTQKVFRQSYDVAVILTGYVRARVQTELSFRVTGRVIEREGDVGEHVEADATLARLDPSEQQADVDSAKAALVGAEATMRQALATFERQKALLAKGFTTQSNYDSADKSRLTAAGSFDGAKAQLAAAIDALSYTRLHAGHPGIITDRYIEVGQVAQSGQPAFGFAQDGPRDAVFSVYESIFLKHPSGNGVDLALVADPEVKARGHIREISPVVDATNGTVQVKVEIDANAPRMPLGAAVTGEGHWQLADAVVLPWTAMTSKNGQTSVWVVDPATHAVVLRPVVVELYEKDKTVLRAGLQPGETVVTEGGKFLREGQIVRMENPERS